MSAPVILTLMSACFLAFGYLGVPVPFALLGGVFIGASLADVSHASIVQKVFDGVDNEALLAIPFFLLVGELMSSANVVVRISNLSLALVGHIRGGLSQTVAVFSIFLFRDVRLDHRRCRGHEPCARRPDEARGLQPGVHCRAD